MRVRLAYELGRFSADKRLAVAFDDLVKDRLADVFVSDDEDERVMLKIKADGTCLIVAEHGLIKSDPGRPNIPQSRLRGGPWRGWPQRGWRKLMAPV